jgi:DNA invertase Pin-like site-specific DNA recombinase
MFCDLPHVPSGAMGRFLLTQMASVAELEAGLISERTKAALAAAKARGVKLGNPNGARALRGKQAGNKQAVAAVRANAGHRAANLRTIVDDLRSQGLRQRARYRCSTERARHSYCTRWRMAPNVSRSSAIAVAGVRRRTAGHNEPL